jgi:hypothetical protein
MAVLFISHSRKDAAAIIPPEARLQTRHHCRFIR